MLRGCIDYSRVIVSITNDGVAGCYEGADVLGVFPAVGAEEKVD